MQAWLFGKSNCGQSKGVALIMKHAALPYPYSVQVTPAWSPAPCPPKRYGFLDFPSEIRNHIYNYVCQYPDCRSLYAHYNRQIDEYYEARKAGKDHVSFPVWNWEVKGFTIMLLCKQITRECRLILESRFLLIDRIPPFPQGANTPLPLAAFITQQTLQYLKQLEVRFTMGQGNLGSGWFWFTFLEGIFDILAEKNSLVELHIILCMTSLGNPGAWREDQGDLDKLRFKVSVPLVPHSSQLPYQV